MHARHRLMGIAAALAFGLMLLQAPDAAAAAEKAAAEKKKSCTCDVQQEQPPHEREIYIADYSPDD